MRRFYSLILILAFLYSCSVGGTKEIGDDVLEVSLTGTPLQEKTMMVTGTFVALWNDTLVLRSSDPDALLNLYTIKGDSLLRKCGFLNRGNGPKEMNMFSFWTDNSARKLTLLNMDGSLGYGLEMNFSNPDSCLRQDNWRRLDLRKITNFRSGSGFVCLPDDRILIVGGVYNTPVILSEINVEGQVAVPINFWPEDGFTERFQPKQAIYMGNASLFRNMKTNQLLYTCGKGKYAFIFKIENGKFVQEKILFDRFPSYVMSKDGMNYTLDANCEPGFKVVVTDSLIYMRPEEYKIEKGTTPKEYKGYPYYYNDKIYVFNWEGIMVKKYILDTPFHDFIVDKNNQIMYVSTESQENGETIIKRYNL